MATGNRKPLMDKISALPRERIPEVEDFVDFISQRDAEQKMDLGLNHAALTASAPSFAKVWNNPEDDVYDAL